MIAALLMTVTPALPPSGPVRGRYECLLDRSLGVRPASLELDEAGFEPDPMLIQTDGRKPERLQGKVNQLVPLNVEVRDVEVASDSLINIRGTKGQVLGRLIRSPADDIGSWFNYELADGDGFRQVGVCFGRLSGRLERPVVFTDLSLMRID